MRSLVRHGFIFLSLVLVLAANLLRGAEAPDWPQFHGPRGDNLSTDTGLMKRWPAAGRDSFGQRRDRHGFSSVVLAEGRIYTAGM